MKYAHIEPLESRIAPATISISNPTISQLEGDTGITAYVFNVTISEAPPADSTVDFTVAGVTATAGDDFEVVAPGTLTFTATELTRSITVNVIGDTVGEDDETFTVTLSNPSAPHTLGTNAVGTGTIRNDPTLTITKTDDVIEGDSGTQTITFTATLTEGPATTNISMGYRIVDSTATQGQETATAGQDFQPVSSGAFLFTPGGATSFALPVTILGDTVEEADETFRFEITTVTNGVTTTELSDVAKVGDRLQATIKTDLLTVTPLTPTIVEGASGQSLLSFQVRPGEYSGTFPVKISYRTESGGASGNAIPGVDFSSTSGELTFNDDTPQTVTVPIYGDLVAEASETFTFRANFTENQGITVPSFVRNVTSTIVNDDVAFEIVPFVTSTGGDSLAEGNSSTQEMTFRVTMTGAITAPVTVNYRTVDVAIPGVRDAIAGQDFVAETGSVTFTPGGPATQDISITINGDMLPEMSESFSVELTSVNPVVGLNSSITRASATGIIKNDDSSVSISGGTVAEGQDGTRAITFTATLTQALPADATFTYSTTNGAVAPLVLGGRSAASSVDDYIAVSNGTFTILANQLTADFTVTVRGDTTIETDEVFTVSLPSNVPDTLIGTISALGVITNDDPFVSIGDVTVTEGTGGTATATFVVTLTQAPAVGQTVTVKFSTDSAMLSATEDVDYAKRLNETLTFNPGETVKTITIDILSDNRFEAAESFVVTLSDANRNVGATVTPLTISRATGTATILDDDTPTVSIVPAVRTAEDDGPALFAVSLSNPTDREILVDFGTQDGTALAGIDYTATAGTLTFLAGATGAALSQNVSVPLAPDAADELDETFRVVLFNPRFTGGTATLGNATSTGTIANDEVSVAIGDASVSESAGTMNFTISRTGPSTHPVTVFYTTQLTPNAAPIRATSGADFTAKSGSIVIPAGAATGTLSVTILNDVIFEADQTFQVFLSGITNGVISDTTGIGTITNDDAAPTVAIVPSVSFSEGNTGNVARNVTVTLSQASEVDVDVDFGSTPGTAFVTSDFIAAVGTLRIPAGLTSNTISVDIVGDSTAEPNETFTIALSAPTNATLGNATSTITILNDDTVPTLSIADVSGQEDAGDFTFFVTLSRSYTEQVTVQFTTVDSTALAGSDFTSMSGTLIFTPGQTSRPIVVPINSDTTAELDERFLVRLSTPTNATIASSEAVGFIQNDEVAFTIVDLTLSEEGAGDIAQTAFVTVSRTGTAAATVQFRTVDGTAVSTGGRDFTAATGTLDFAAGELSKTIAIPITRESAYEFAEQFTVELFAPVNSVIAAGTATVTITDNDAAPTLSVVSASGIEDVLAAGSTTNRVNNKVAFTVQLSAANEREDITVQFETLDGTAVSTGAVRDFTAPADGVGELRFAKGQTSLPIDIPTLVDARDESDETFTLRLKNANAAFTAGGATLDVLGTIEDNDAAPTVSITSALTIGEGESGAANRVFTVSLSAPSEKSVTVQWRTLDSLTGPLAAADVDYTAVPLTTLTFAPNETSKTISVAIADDSTDEENERFDVILENPNANVTLGTTVRGTATITDNDAAPFISIGDSSIVEGAAPAMLFTVSLSALSGRDITVKYSTSDGTATSSGPFADFAAVTGATLMIAAGQLSGTISIPIIDDGFREEVAVIDGNDFTLAGEKFTLALSDLVNATAGDLTAEGLISNGADDVLGLVVTGGTVVEGATGQSEAVFTVQLSAPAVDAVTFDVATRNGTATAGSDFAAIANAGSIAGATETMEDQNGTMVTVRRPGGTSAQFTVNVTGDGTFEATESFFLDLSGFEGGVTVPGIDSDGRLAVRGTIYNDDINLFNNGRTLQWVDVDGDLVTLTTTVGSFAAVIGATFNDNGTARPWLIPTGDFGGRQLALLSLLDLGGFRGAAINITATPQPGFTGVTDGVVHVGEIRAAQRVGLVDWNGVDLRSVTVEGDLQKITAGDNISSTALGRLDVHSLGARAPIATSLNTLSEILGPVGTVIVRGDIGGRLEISGQEFGRIGTLTVEGALRGGADANTGQVLVSGFISRATIGEVIGGAGENSGALLGNRNNGGALGNVTVLGAVTGGSGRLSGNIQGVSLGHVKLGSLEGGSGENSGFIFATIGNIASLTIEGALTGGTGVNSGQVFAQSAMGHVKVEEIVGGGGRASGVIGISLARDSNQAFVPVQGRSIASLTVEDSITGGAGEFSGSIGATTAIGPVKIGNDLVGGTGATSAAIISNGTLGKVTVGDDVIGGSAFQSGIITSAVRMSGVTIGGDLTGGAGERSGAVFAGFHATNSQSQPVFIGGTLTSLKIGGPLTGGGGVESGIVKAKSASSVIIGGPIVGGEGALSGSVRFLDDRTGDGFAGRITVGENPAGESIIGGAGQGSGRIETRGNLSQAILEGDIVGGTANLSGGLVVGGVLTSATIRGDIEGGDAPATGARLQNSGFLQAGLLRSAHITGSLIAGDDLGAGNSNSGVIRTGRIESLVIDGSVTGTAANAAVISGQAAIDSSNVGIRSLLIKGSVSFAEILSGFDGNTTQSDRGNVSSADAQIGRVEIRGSAQHVNIIAGAAPGADGRFGDATDVISTGSGVRDSSRVISSIASVIFRGGAANNDANATHGIVAQHIVSVGVGPAGLAIPGLLRGAGNDLATSNPDGSALIAANFRAVEIAV